MVTISWENPKRQAYATPYHELKQRHARLMAEAGQCARQSAKEIADLQATCTALQGRILAERAQRDADIAALRERVASASAASFFCRLT
jgi:hypothetical protein